MFTIVIQEKGGEQRRMVFNKPEVTIGRVQGNDIVLPKGNVSKRHARIVLKDVLQWDPLLDVYLNRVPSAFLGDRGEMAERVGDLATGMGHEDALLIFPEGKRTMAGERKNLDETLAPVVVLAVGRRDADAELPEPLASRERAPRSREPLDVLLLGDPRRDRRVA